jgi:protein TonB
LPRTRTSPCDGTTSLPKLIKQFPPS